MTSRPVTTRRWGAAALGAAVGTAGATAWLVTVAVAPPVPADGVGATLSVLASCAVAAVAVLVLRRREAVVAALSAGVTSCALVVGAVAAMMPRVPDRWVPVIVTQALTPADNVRESRIEAVDPYVAVGALGVLLLAALVVGLAEPLRRRLAAWMVPPVPTPVPQVRQPL